MTTTDVTTDLNTTESTTTRLPRPLYAVAGAGELAYRQLRTLPGRVEALREQLTPRVRTLRAELPGRVEALRTELPGRVEAMRTEMPARVNTLVAGAREVYGDLVARGEQVVGAARTRRLTGGGVTTAPVKAVRKAVRRSAPTTATHAPAKKATTPKSRAPRA